jgi:hypothetical protein
METGKLGQSGFDWAGERPVSVGWNCEKSEGLHLGSLQLVSPPVGTACPSKLQPACKTCDATVAAAFIVKTFVSTKCMAAGAYGKDAGNARGWHVVCVLISAVTGHLYRNS